MAKCQGNSGYGWGSVYCNWLNVSGTAFYNGVWWAGSGGADNPNNPIAGITSITNTGFTVKHKDTSDFGTTVYWRAWK